MIISKSTSLSVFVLAMLLTAMFVSLLSIFSMPDYLLGGENIYVLTSTNDKNPIRSNLDIGIAYGLENMSYVEAVSPEIFVFTTINNNPVTVRGVIFKKFMNLENGKILKGHIPYEPAEAMIGCDASKKLNIGLNKSITLIGSFKPSIVVVKITGIYKTDSPADDEILVSLDTARKLAGISPGKVSVIRVKTTDVSKIEKMMNPEYPKFTATLNATTQVYFDEKFNVSVNIKNLGVVSGKCNYTIKFQNQTYSGVKIVEKNISFNVSFTAHFTGKYNITIDVYNDIFYYTCYTQISVMQLPVLVSGPSYTIVNNPTIYILKTINSENISGGIVNIRGPGMNKTFEYRGLINITFPETGLYRISYNNTGYATKTVWIHVYRKGNISNVLTIYPRPVGGIIYATALQKIYLNTSLTNPKIFYILNDNVRQNYSGPINISMYEMGNYEFEVFIIHNDTLYKKDFLLHIVTNTTPNVKPWIENGSRIIYSEYVNFTVYDGLPLEKISYSINNGTPKYISVNQSFSKNIFNYSYNLTLQVNSTKFFIKINVLDAGNSYKKFVFDYIVTIPNDIFPPEIDAHNVTIWGGNYTLVRAYDNLRVSNISVSVFGKTFNSSYPYIRIPSVFIHNYSAYFVPPGTYRAVVTAYDVNGNRNTSTFFITINNSAEKNPPIILGPKYINLSASPSYKISAFDNTQVILMQCYEGTTLIKTVYSSSIYINASDLTNGVHHLAIVAEDINHNFAFYYLTAVKNYTDTQKPSAYLKYTTVWSGNNTEVDATDNVGIANITVYAFGRYFYATNNSSYVRVPTSFRNNDSVYFVPPGNYTITVWVRDYAGNLNMTNLTLTINNSGEKNPPVIIEPYETYYYSQSSIFIRAYDNVGIKNMSAYYDHKEIAYSNTSFLYIPCHSLPAGYVSLKVVAFDVNGNNASITFSAFIIDNTPPEIDAHNVTIWGGNYTLVRAYDNLRVSNISVSVFGKTFNSSYPYIRIPSVFIHNYSAYFVPPGTYRAVVTAYDVNGNRNTSTFFITINNSAEKNPPIILGPKYTALSVTKNATFYAFDNVRVVKMALIENDNTLITVNSSMLRVHYHSLPPGWHNVTIVSWDANGNIAYFNTTIRIIPNREVVVQASLMESVITTRESAVLYIRIINEGIACEYNLTIDIDGEEYYTEIMHLNDYEIKDLYVNLPELSAGTHTISLENITLKLKVTKEIVEKLPIDLVLKYAKNLKITESQNVIYKGFQISEGNFILTMGSVFTVTSILVFLGIYSSALKGLKENTIGVLRAIGASNKQVFRFLMKDFGKYIVPAMGAGIASGVAITFIINELGLLTAFGHKLIIRVSPLYLLIIFVLLTVFFSLTFMLVFKISTTRKVVHMMGRNTNLREVSLEEVLNEK